MRKQQYSIEIHAPKGRVWSTMWQDETFPEWASIIDPGSHMVGDLKEGNEVQFISSVSGYGVTSFVEKLVPNEFLLLRSLADTQSDGQREREKQWTGSKETYSLSEKNGITTLTITSDVPIELDEMFKVRYPRALERIKQLAETKKG